MSRKRYMLLMLMGACCIVVSLWLLASEEASTPRLSTSSSRDSESELPGISAEQYFDAGIVPPNSILTHEFKITNKSKETVGIQVGSVSCGCTQATLTANTIAPGATEKLEMVFDVSGKYGFQQIDAAVVVQEASAPLVFALAATISNPATLYPPKLDAGLQKVNKDFILRIRVLSVSETGEALEFVGSESTLPEISILSTEPLSQWEMIITILLQPQEGPRKGEMTFKFSGETGNAFFPITYEGI
ncbi:MAG: hypothetical protein PWP23_714 [Candidatus Sumerlaeota bacterium]|nr:hypothetical protein [Candidatus Sumerlaeota bacterium]